MSHRPQAHYAIEGQHSLPPSCQLAPPSLQRPRHILRPPPPTCSLSLPRCRRSLSRENSTPMSGGLDASASSRAATRGAMASNTWLGSRVEGLLHGRVSERVLGESERDLREAFWEHGQPGSDVGPYCVQRLVRFQGSGFGYMAPGGGRIMGGPKRNREEPPASASTWDTIYHPG